MDQIPRTNSQIITKVSMTKIKNLNETIMGWVIWTLDIEMT
jgi:hypothetical protein